VDDDFEAAVMTYIAHPLKSEDATTYSLRKKLQETRDYQEALKQYPPTMNFEIAILNHLVGHPTDYIGALLQLPKNLLTMFIYAYQSYLFNRILSERIRQQIPLHEAVPGDIILPIRQGLIEEQGILVTPLNCTKVTKQLKKHKAYISGVLIGSDSCFSEGTMGEIEHAVVEAEGLDPRDFIIPDIPFLTSSGTRRSLLAPINQLSWTWDTDSMQNEKQAVSLSFSLSKGCYATSLLREIMKADSIRNY
jgi:tRNA pseudouridine13 synthase